MAKKNIKKENFFKENYKKSWNFLKETKNFIYFSIGTFILFILIGYFFPVFFRQEIIDYLKQLSESLSGLNAYQLMGYIIWNNSTAAFFSIIFGIAFGIFPLITLIFNGYLIGFVANAAVAQDGFFVLWRLLPHGVFELPAIIISISVGLRLGTGIFRKKSIFSKEFGEAMRLFLFIVIPLLIIAGIIEGLLVFFF